MGFLFQIHPGHVLRYSRECKGIPYFQKKFIRKKRAKCNSKLCLVLDLVYVDENSFMALQYLTFKFKQLLLFIASYYRQLSADIKIKSYKIKASFVIRESPKAMDSKTGINLMIFILIFLDNCL